MTAEQLFELRDDGLRHELVEGVLHTMALAFVRADRVPDADTSGFPALAPDLVVEVVSPSDRATQVTAEALEWLHAGVRLVWVVDPETRTVTAYRPDGVRVLRGEDTLDGGDVLPGSGLPLAELRG
ncbi:Putative restriction endonuclease [Geodermatophilus pulveris]|uniref:Putative restriction endonuclease n=1 Tax=Geodermatophilus pulveris TaxID=1564159 RepID=A0A239DC10_9ACTN|nr:Uma2 family endonuclease [Geodermatophilus pulveris]SNS29837.1 Putative restriction endonuclease [Geodermatophilus pulveris]